VSDPVVLVRDEGPLRWLALNRPDVRNALDATLVDALREELDAAAGSGARALVLTGSGPVFSAGADLRALRALREATPEANESDSRRLAALFEAIALHPLPVIAAVNGHAIAGGAGLAVACDVTVVARGALLGFTEVRIGFVPAIILNFLMRVAGEKVVRELCLTGRRIDADEALRLGLVSRVVEPDRLEGAVAALGAELAEASPEAIAATKRLFVDLRGLSLSDGLHLAARRNAEARATADCREGVAAFLEKRKPRWRNEPEPTGGGES